MKKSYIAVLALLLATAPAFAQTVPQIVVGASKTPLKIISVSKALPPISTEIAFNMKQITGSLPKITRTVYQADRRVMKTSTMHIDDSDSPEALKIAQNADYRIRLSIEKALKEVPPTQVPIGSLDSWFTPESARTVIAAAKKMPRETKVSLLGTIQKYLENNMFPMNIRTTEGEVTQIVRNPLPTEGTDAVLNGIIPTEWQNAIETSAENGVIFYTTTCSRAELEQTLNSMDLRAWKQFRPENLVNVIAANGPSRLYDIMGELPVQLFVTKGPEGTKTYALLSFQGDRPGLYPIK